MRVVIEPGARYRPHDREPYRYEGSVVELDELEGLRLMLAGKARPERGVRAERAVLQRELIEERARRGVEVREADVEDFERELDANRRRQERGVR